MSGTVDEILASGEYTDRRFRLWEHSRNTRTGEECWMVWEPFFRRTELTPAQMRLLILRDKHRDVCEGLRNCRTHPVPHVIAYEDDLDGLRRWGWGFAVYGVGSGFPFDYDTLPAAMDAARTLAVSE